MDFSPLWNTIQYYMNRIKNREEPESEKPPKEKTRLSPEALTRLLEDYLSENSDETNLNHLADHLEIVEDQVIDALETRGSQDTTLVFYILILLGEHRPERLKWVLLKWLEDDTSDPALFVRHLTGYGSADLLPAIRKAFEHENDMIASSARGGVLSAAKAGRIEPAFRDYVVEHCAALLHGPKPSAAYDPIRIIEAVAPKRLPDLLLDERILRPDHPLLSPALGALNRLNQPAPEAFLRTLLNMRPPDSSFRWGPVQGAAVAGLSLHEVPDIESILADILDHEGRPRETLEMIAWGVRFRRQGLTPLTDTAIELGKAPGKLPASAPVPERAACLFQDASYGAYTLSFAEWWADPDCYPAQEVLTALRFLGASRHAEIFESAMKTVGGPSRNPLLRALQFSLITEKKRDRLAALEQQWQELPGWELYVWQWDWKNRHR